MINIEKQKSLLGRKVKLNDGKRDLEINIGEIARDMGCLSGDVLLGLKRLQNSGFSKEDYTLTVLESSSILNQ